MASAAGDPAKVAILAADGTIETQFSVLDGKFRGGLNVDAGDIDGDGVADILLGARAGGGPRVEAYRADGTRLLTFDAYAASFRGGVDVAVGDVDGDGQDDIVTLSGFESPGHLRIFTHQGAPRSLPIFPFGRGATYGGAVAVGDVKPGHDGQEIVVAPLGPGAGTATILDARGRTLGRFRIGGKDARGFALATAAIDDRPGDEVLVAGRDTGRVEIYAADGQRLTRIRAAQSPFYGEVAIAGTPTQNVAVVPVPSRAEGRTDLPRYIDLDLSDQLLRSYRLGVKISQERVSTGKWSMPTPKGTFQTRNRIRTAYSRRYGLYMDYWMAITPDGAYGIHALPYWRLKGGGILYEGEAHLGTPVSHGCIRLGPAAAKRLFDWAPIGTTVVIHD